MVNPDRFNVVGTFEPVGFDPEVGAVFDVESMYWYPKDAAVCAVQAMSAVVVVKFTRLIGSGAVHGGIDHVYVKPFAGPCVLL